MACSFKGVNTPRFALSGLMAPHTRLSFLCSLWMAGRSVWTRLGREAAAALAVVDTEAAAVEEEEADTSVEAEEEVGSGLL